MLNAMSSLNRRESSHMSESAATTAMRSANTTMSSQLVRTKVSGMVLSAADSRTDYRKLGIFGSLLAISGRSRQSPVRMSHPVGDCGLRVIRRQVGSLCPTNSIADK